MSPPVQFTAWNCIDCGRQEDDHGNCDECWYDHDYDVASLWCNQCDGHTEHHAEEDWG